MSRMKFHVKKGDEVVLISGADKGKRGRIISVAPKKQRVIVEGARMIKKHMRKSQQNPQGAIVEREGTVHISNVMMVDSEGNKTRVVPLTGKTIGKGNGGRPPTRPATPDFAVLVLAALLLIRC